MQPTGISPHVTILGEVRAARNKLKAEIESRKLDLQNIAESQNTMCQQILAGVSTILEERSIETGVPTCESMASSIMKKLENAGLLYHLRTSDDVAIDTVDTASDAALHSGEGVEESSEPVYPTYHWGGGMHLFPQGLKLRTGRAERA
ncbi:hypothetical protein L917_15801 [Phytophthora nicotianae]|uniref:Uncharacterized protein n=2 Tax=Phytophthora nicotianae TaxID=4792 RepID=W2KGI8_PHYNI|nr:hypothetical protein L916_21744 [Phytophthora nicotianae]ETL84346.1 hypothetical protein L917_15801 [Phytophthora nicotianae]ETM42092.1 hypothetical protein L914_12203 [Phytophthora nicotianae]